MLDEFGVSTSVDDVHRSLSQLFGDGRGAYPEGAYLDSVQFHDVYHDIGSQDLPSRDLIRYALSIDGISTLIVGIGHIDDKGDKCQIEQNLAAAQLTALLDTEEMGRIENMVTSAGKDSANDYFKNQKEGVYHYKVRALDVVGNSAESISLAIDFRSGRKTS